MLESHKPSGWDNCVINIYFMKWFLKHMLLEKHVHLCLPQQSSTKNKFRRPPVVLLVLERDDFTWGFHKVARSPSEQAHSEKRHLRAYLRLPLPALGLQVFHLLSFAQSIRKQNAMSSSPPLSNFWIVFPFWWLDTINQISCSDTVTGYDI